MAGTVANWYPVGAMNAIAAESLTKYYGRRVGIYGVNLTVPPGVIFGFLGPNGSGKTTTIRLLLALLRPSGGKATVFGLDCWRYSHRIKEDVGYVPGDLRLYSWMSARSALKIFGRVRHRDLVSPGLELARRFQLNPDVQARRMSRGMRQKLGLILALVHQPKLLVLDEPTSSLDPLMQQLLYDELRKRAAAGATIFFSSHALSEVEDLCDRVAILREGRLVADETLEALRGRAKREVTLRWGDHKAAEDTAVPGFLDLRQRRGGEWICTLEGSVMDLVRWSASQPLDDLTVGRPDLESLFHQFYEQGESTR